MPRPRCGAPDGLDAQTKRIVPRKLLRACLPRYQTFNIHLCMAPETQMTDTNYSGKRAIEQMQLRVTVRAFAHMHPYTVFWHAHAGKRICAPGGKWAKRDRAAFEFIQLRM